MQLIDQALSTEPDFWPNRKKSMKKSKQFLKNRHQNITSRSSSLIKLNN